MLNSIKGSNFKIVLFFTIIFLSFYRSPYIFTNGRFFAEEGLHFANAWKNGFFSGLIFIEASAGYFNLIANILASIATLIKLENAPFVNIYGSFIVILLLPFLVLFRGSILFSNDHKKVIGAIILFCSPPFVPEIWLNSINLQVYLCLITIVVLFMDNLSSKQKIFNHFIIFISGFSGIYTCCLLPLFAFNYILKKNFYNLLNLMIILFSTISQLSLIIFFKLNNTLHDSVLKGSLDFSGFHLFFYNNIFKPFFGRQFIHLTWENLTFFFPFINYVNAIIGFIVFLFFILLRYYKNIFKHLIKDKILVYLVYIFFAISVIIILGSLGNYYGGRYSVIPGVTLILIVFHLYKITNKKILNTIFLSLIVCSLVSGIYQFRPPTKNVKHQYIKYLDCIDCPEWKKELNYWKNDKNYGLKIWPYPRKTMMLN